MQTRRDVLLALAAGALPAFAKIDGVEMGVVGDMVDFAPTVAEGFDYFEAKVGELSLLSDAEFAEVRRNVEASPIRCSRVNNFIRDLKVVGPSVDASALKAYMKRMLDRVGQLGAEIVVWGSAGSRNVPQGFSRDIAWQQIQEFLQYAGDIAGERKMVIAIEPLRKQETNIINTGGEALRLVEEVKHRHVKMMIDYYHMRLEKEDSKILVDAADQIVHLHFANPAKRRWPKSLAEDETEYARFFAFMKQIHYKAGMSIEGSGRPQTDGAASLAFFRREMEA
jgi:D-psicose/D-tagatose/L-ribulose 3-epimerase